MQQHLQIENKEITITFNEEAACWQTSLTIDGRTVEIEIDLKFHRLPNVDWEHFTRFLQFVGKPGFIADLVTRSLSLVTELGKAFSVDRGNDSKDWKMEFNQSLYYNGRPEDGISPDGLSFSLIFNYVMKRERLMDADSYGLYLVDVEGIHIVGVRRYQC